MALNVQTNFNNDTVNGIFQSSFCFWPNILLRICINSCDKISQKGHPCYELLIILQNMYSQKILHFRKSKLVSFLTNRLLQPLANFAFTKNAK